MATIIFDFDGTLADSFNYVADFMAHEAGRRPLPEAEKNELRHLSMLEMTRRLGFHWWQAIFLYFKGRARMKRAIKHLKPFPGIPEVVRKLSAEGHELFVVSANSAGNVRRFLREHKLDNYFIEIYGGASLFGKGPTLRRLLRDQNLELDQSIYIGDELRDIAAAKAINMRIIAVSWGFAETESLKTAEPYALADTPEELLRLLEVL